jgi:hypothetical protein
VNDARAPRVAATASSASTPYLARGSATDVVAELSSAFEQATAAGGLQARHYRIAGVDVSLRFAATALSERLSPAFAHVETTVVRNSTLRVHLWDSASSGAPAPSMPPVPAGDPAGALYHFHEPPIRGVYQPGVGSLSAYDSESGQAWYWVDSAADVPYWDQACPLRQILFWSLADRNCLQVHGASIGTPAGGVLVVGKGGSGKSTVALSALGSELLYAGDDYVAVTTDPSPAVASLYNSGKLEPDHVGTLLPHLLPLLANAERLDAEKAVLFVHDHFPEQTTPGYPLVAVLVPRVVRERRESRIAPTSRAAALAALAPSTILQLHTAGSEALSTMSRLVARVPCYTLELGTDVTALPCLISEFLATRS